MSRRALLGSSLLITAGLALGACGHLPAPTVAFDDFEVSEAGGVDGRRNVLFVQRDGSALWMTRESAAGRLDPTTMSRLAELLESERFRGEAGRKMERGPARCSDQIYLTVTLGALRVSEVSGGCGGGPADLPAYREILALTAEARSGRFPAPLGVDAPALPELVLERRAIGDRPPYRIAVRADGRAGVTVRARPAPDRALTVIQRDALRLLVARLPGSTDRVYTRRALYRLTVGSPAAGVEADELPLTNQEFQAVTSLLERALDIG